MDYILPALSFLITTAFGITTFILSLQVMAKDRKPSKKLIAFLLLGVAKTTLWLFLIDKNTRPFLFAGLLIELIMLLSPVFYLLIVKALKKAKRP